ncbi:hypothetical protein [Dictyobacter aurantiacus]|uniref:Uncharacterized protein n=1 Tax=Dictyobacter aurantiacus TaxID=1936993 RepID=A0A401ZD71_9CHLR|nr:hypothetical protein [Dictyobacter aurantiacus]GCE04795.1 hypothetical protein KDAU_21240 [Dictyobacter aurantiacus]
MNPDHGQEVTEGSQPTFFRRRSKLLLSSVLSLIVIAGAVFSIVSVTSQSHISKAAAPTLVGDVATYQSKIQLAQGIRAVSPQQIQLHSRAATTNTTPPPAFNNVGISAKANPAAGNFDGAGYSYSFDQLLATSIEPGIPFTYKGVSFQWPNINNQTYPTQADNWQASGQVLPISGRSTATIGFIGAASNGTATGTGTITYSDGTTGTYTLTLSDWTLGGGNLSQVAASNKIVSAQMARNSKGGSQNVKTYLFYTAINTDATKTVLSVTLPKVTTKAQLHIFTYGAGPASYTSPYNSNGLSDDAYTSAGNFDGSHNSYSSSLLPWGIGYSLLYNHDLAGNYGMTFKWPDVLPGDQDNYIAQGQQISVGQIANAAKLGFIGAATGGPSYGTAYINYSDGTQQQFQLGFSDWTLNGFTQPPSFNNRLFAGMAGRNTLGGRQNVNTYLFYTEADIDPTKTVDSVTLPSSVSKGQLHVYTIAEGQQGFFDNVGVSDDNGPLFGNLDGGGHSYSSQALQNAGIPLSSPNNLHPFTINGTSFTIKYGGGSNPDNWVANGQFIPVNNVANATALAFLGSATGGFSSGYGHIYYTDGTSQQYTLTFSDWCSFNPSTYNYIVARMPYRNTAYGRQNTMNYLYEAEIPLQPGKTVSSVQLPLPTTSGKMHVFAAAEHAGNLNNVGITNDNATSVGAFDGNNGNSYSAQALQSAGLVAGQNFSYNGYSFPWPAAGTLDNYLADGQTLAVTPPAGAKSLAFLGSSSNGIAGENVTIIYTDGTWQLGQLIFFDWCNSYAPGYVPTIAATMSYRNTHTGRQTLKNYIYYQEVTLDPTKTVQSIRLPEVGSLHVFSYAFK